MVIAAFLLLSLGITVIYSSSPVLAYQQIIFGVAGFILYLLLRSFDYKSLAGLIKPAYFIALFLLVVTLILGIETRGSVRWIPIGPFNLQPSEFAKPVLILALALFWSKNLPSWRNIFKSFLILLPIAALIFRQPDLGTSLTVFFIWLIILFASQISLLKLLSIGMAVLLILPTSWFFLQDYQKQRVESFLSPAQDPQGIGFQVIQSTIAVGSGGIFGRGIGRGTQSRLQFLPEFRTDFIFAFISEELGFVGTLILLTLYGVIFYYCLRILNRVGDRFGELIVIGVVGMMFFQIVINVGMNIGLLPITGITLPLLSYGGSSVVTTLLCLGLAASVSKFGNKRKDVDSVDTLI